MSSVNIDWETMEISIVKTRVVPRTRTLSGRYTSPGKLIRTYTKRKTGKKMAMCWYSDEIHEYLEEHHNTFCVSNPSWYVAEGMIHIDEEIYTIVALRFR